MSPGPADQVNANELAARAALVERQFGLGELPRVQEAGGLHGTRIDAELRFGTFEGRATVEVRVAGSVVLTCQRCLRPCECALQEHATLAVVRDDADEVPGGYEPFVDVPEQLSLTALVEEQVLLALPLVPMHEAGAGGCSRAADVVPLAPGSRASREAAVEPVEDEKQMPFANLRELLERKRERGPASGE